MPVIWRNNFQAQPSSSAHLSKYEEAISILISTNCCKHFSRLECDTQLANKNVQIFLQLFAIDVYIYRNWFYRQNLKRLLRVVQRARRMRTSGSIYAK